MKKLVQSLEKIENWIMIATFATMVIAFFIQVLNRNFIQASMPWLEELAVFCMIYMIMLGTEAGLRDGSQIAVTAIVDRLKGRVQLGVRIFSKLVVTLFAAGVFWNSLALVQRQISAGQLSPAMQIPMAIPYLGITLPFLAITIVQAVLLIGLVRDFIQGESHSDVLEGDSEMQEAERLLEEMEAEE